MKVQQQWMVVIGILYGFIIYDIYEVLPGLKLSLAGWASSPADAVAGIFLCFTTAVILLDLVFILLFHSHVMHQDVWLFGFDIAILYTLARLVAASSTPDLYGSTKDILIMWSLFGLWRGRVCDGPWADHDLRPGVTKPRSFWRLVFVSLVVAGWVVMTAFELCPAYDRAEATYGLISLGGGWQGYGLPIWVLYVVFIAVASPIHFLVERRNYSDLLSRINASAAKAEQP